MVIGGYNAPARPSFPHWFVLLGVNLKLILADCIQARRQPTGGKCLFDDSMVCIQYVKDGRH